MRSLTAPRASRARVTGPAVPAARVVVDGPRAARAFADRLRAACRAAIVIACLALPPLLLPAPAPAQDLDDVSVSGSVVDQHGAVVVGARVTATHAATKTTRAAVTDGEGRYRFVELPPGVYSLRVAREGFAPAEAAGLELGAGRAARLDFTLRPAGLDEEQAVVSERDAPPVDTTRTVVGATLAREEIESLPTAARSPLDFVFTLGGVAEEPLSTRDVAEDRDASGRGSVERAATTPEEAGTFSLAGGPAYSNNITVDGLDNNDDRSARERFQPSLEAVEEVQVITNQFSAEYGRASGGRVNLRTRGGANTFRGRAFYFFRDEALDANTWNNNRRGLKRLPFQQHTPGFTLSGPLPLPRPFAPRGEDDRPRTFFFTAYEYDTVLDTALVDALVPVAQNPLFPLPAPTTLVGRRFEPAATAPNAPAELAPFVERTPTPLRNHVFTARLDHNFRDTHNAALLLQLGRSRNLRQFGGGLRLAAALQGRTRDTESISYSDNFVFSPALVNQLRAQLSRLRPSLRAGVHDTPVVLITINDPLSSDDPSDRSGTLVAGSSTTGATDRRETRFQLQDTLTILRGPHTLKLGADLQRINSTFIDLADATGTYTFTSAGDFLAGTPSRFRQRFNTESTQRNTYTGLFIHDEWRLRPNLVLSYGLRYEQESILRDRNNLAPRLALAYDPFGTGKTVVRLGAGVFFNRALVRTLDDFTLGTQLIEFDTNTLPVSERRPFIAAHLRFPDTLTADSPAARQLGTLRTDFSRRLDPALRIPESYQFNLGFERELTSGFVLEADYTFNRGLHLWREFNANAPRLPFGFRDFTEYLLSRDFANFRDPSGARPIYDANTAGELVRFTLADGAGADAITRVVEFGVPVTLFDLASVSSTTTLEAALAALQPLRPDPTRTQVEQLVSGGDSFYHGLNLSARRRLARNANGFGLSLRAAYTLSRLVDDGVVNTSSALRPGDFRSERSPSLLDRRHRLALSTVFDAPRSLGSLRLSTVLRLASGAPFNLSLGGADRNLDDVSNDRPNFTGDLSLIRSRRPGTPLDPRLLEAFSLPPVGQTGNLPRNAGRGPARFTFDINLTREFRFGDKLRLRPVLELDNVLNKTVYTFGAEFINFNALGPDATDEQRRAFLDTFLVPTRTLRPRTVRVGLRLDF